MFGCEVACISDYMHNKERMEMSEFTDRLFNEIKVYVPQLLHKQCKNTIRNFYDELNANSKVQQKVKTRVSLIELIRMCVPGACSEPEFNLLEIKITTPLTGEITEANHKEEDLTRHTPQEDNIAITQLDSSPVEISEVEQENKEVVQENEEVVQENKEDSPEQEVEVDSPTRVIEDSSIKQNNSLEESAPVKVVRAASPRKNRTRPIGNRDFVRFQYED